MCAAIVSVLRVLVVDQDPAASLALSAGLQERGFSVTWASDFESATAALRPSKYDALVCAHHLGTHNGLHLVLRARAERADIIAVVTSTGPDQMLQREAAAFGAQHVVAPWTDLNALVTILRSAGVQPA